MAEGSGAGAPRVSPAEYGRLCDFLYRRTGLWFGANRHHYLERRLIERILATGAGGFPAYFARLQADGAELQQFTNLVTVNETYFYREDYQLRCLTSNLLPAVLARKRAGQPLRIWSVPCATGEEPYSIAIWLLENWPEVDGYDVEILASDIDTRALEQAAEGRYGERALMRLPPALVQRYFEPSGKGEWRIVHQLRDSVQFSRANVVDIAQTRRFRSIDVIFCRNMLIYFDDKSRREAAENLYDCLSPGGFICLGHAESMSRISPLFHVARFDDAIVYRKPEESEG